MKKLSALVAAFLLVLVGLAMSQPAGATNIDAAPLTAGHQLQYGTARDSMESAGGEYQLHVRPNLVYLEQLVVVQGANTGAVGWTWQLAPRGDATDDTILALQHDCNLVLYTSTHHALWSTRTSGFGDHCQLAIQGNGNLVLRDAAGRAVWSTRTGSIFLPAGTSLKPGQSLVSRYLEASGRPPATLVMQGDGNLVMYRGNVAVWNSRTFAAGSVATMQTDGNFVVRAPSGKATWASNTRAAGPNSWVALGPCSAEIDNTRGARFTAWFGTTNAC